MNLSVTIYSMGWRKVFREREHQEAIWDNRRTGKLDYWSKGSASEKVNGIESQS